jgi:hypothetical protein
MKMETEARTCQNCKAQFTIAPEAVPFYEKIKVPLPTFCRDCRVARRMAFRNERVLYKRKCDAPGHSEDVVSVFSPDKKQRVYDHTAWWGDQWDPLSYGRDVDFSLPFLEQLKELWAEVPDISVLNINPVNSEYCSITEGNKNCYLVFGGDFNENTLYSTYIFRSRECVDTYWVQNSEYNYETIDCTACSRLFYSRYCESSYNSAFLFNCRNCHDCFGSANLVSRSYVFFNEQYSKEEYAEKLKEFDLATASGVQKAKERFAAHMIKYPRRFAKMIQVVNSSGDNLENCRNCQRCFDVFEGAENCSDVFLVYSKVKDSIDTDHAGLSSELAYESSAVYPASRVFFSRFVFNCHDIQYSYNVHNAGNLFGSIGVRNKQYCILNKQYSKEDYEALVPKIIEHMKAMPYVDAKGRTHAYGEFFPVEMSPFAYNETISQEMYPISKEQTGAMGYVWKDQDAKEYTPTKTASELPDAIADVKDDILKEIIECEHKGTCNDQCSTAFRIIPAELELYRHLGIPLPRLCSSCRHFARVRQRNPYRLWHRKCQCAGAASASGDYKNTAAHFHAATGACPNEFETTYAPERPETVYCEQCYQAEVS